MKYKWWTGKEIDQCKQMYKDGKSIAEIAEILDRGILSITNLLTTERVIENPNTSPRRGFKQIDPDLIKKLREEYPKDTRVVLEQMNDQQAPPVGIHGTVKHVDDIGTIHVHWDNGSSLGIVYGEDRCRKENE